MERFERLTPRQRECLRLVRDLQSTKQIAITLGIKPATVNGYLDDAVALLGARDRRAAALAFADFEKSSPENIRGESIRFELNIRPDPSSALGNEEPLTSASPMREDRVEFDPRVSGPTSRRSSRPWSVGGMRNDLTMTERLLWCLAIATAMLVAFGSLVGTFEAISRIGWAMHSR